MIALISGKIISNDGVALVVLTAGGVGYKVSVKPSSIMNYQIGSDVELRTYMSVSENAMNLYGFEDEASQELFTHFLSVSGIGPKSALHLLSLGSVEEITGAISSSDVEYLTKVSGVGRKTAERVVVELKSKMGDLSSSVTSLNGASRLVGDVVEGLIALGYSALQARDAVKQLDTDNKSSEELMREALQKIK